ncbi:MAG: RHS repeat-associated core domain-containing protein [Candidatus Omnitrophota bacterium]
MSNLFKNIILKFSLIVALLFCAVPAEATNGFCHDMCFGGPVQPCEVENCWWCCEVITTEFDNIYDPVDRYGNLQSMESLTGETCPNTKPETPINPIHGKTDPVNLSNGQFYYNCHDTQIPGREIDLEATHIYNSGSAYNGPYGYGWTFNYHMRLHELASGDVAITTGNGRKLSYTYNGSVYAPPTGRFEELLSNPDGSWTLVQAHGQKYQFDADGKLVQIQNRNDNTITLSYEEIRQPIFGYSPFALAVEIQVMVGIDWRLTQITDTTGRVITLNYNASGLLETIIDGARQYTFTYDSNTNDLLSITKPATNEFPEGVTQSFTYDAEHNLVSMTDARGQAFVQNIYNTDGRVEEQILGGNTISLSYNGNQTVQTDPNGNETVYTFDTNGLLLSREERTRDLRPDDPDSFITAYAYDAYQNQIAQTLPGGNGVKLTYDTANPNIRSKGNLLEVRRKEDMSQPDNNINDIVANFSYEPNFNFVQTATDPNGNTINYTYDYQLSPEDPRYGENGNLAEVAYPEISGETPRAAFRHNQYGQVIEATDPNGNTTHYEYFPQTGYLQRVIEDPNGINAVTQFAYDDFGNLSSVTDGNNHTTGFLYNELGWLTRETDALGFQTKYFYDENGNLIRTERQTDVQGNQWQITRSTYDILNRLTSITDPLNRVTSFEYDLNGNRASVTDALGRITHYDYDERNLLWKATDAQNAVTEYFYNANAKLSRIDDANDNSTIYDHDGFDRLTHMTYADNSFHEYSYDKNSNMTEDLTPSNAAISYEYDVLNRLTAKRYPLNPSDDVEYDYDLGSRLISVQRIANGVAYGYDALNRIVSSEQTLNAIRYALGYAYDLAGNRIGVDYPSGQRIGYGYDALNRISQIFDNGTLLGSYGYDVLGRRTKKSLLGGGPTGIGPQKTTSYSYDLADQLVKLDNSIPTTSTVPDAGIISQLSYGYDLAGNRTAKKTLSVRTDPNGTGNTPHFTSTTLKEIYSYDPTYQIIGFDISTEASVTHHSFAYDLLGNRTQADDITYQSNSLNQYTSVDGEVYAYDGNGNLTDDGNNTYSYDSENRLLSSVFSLGSLVYEYDGLGRRISKNIGGRLTYFIYDGDRIIEERSDSGSLLASYVYGSGLDEVLTMNRNNQNYFYFQDGLGSTSEITNSNGQVLESYAYDVYGAPTIRDTDNRIAPSSVIGNPFMFTGQEYDSETGNYHYNARAYHPLTGRFHQRDPLGNIDSENLYTYVLNNPINLIDPYGELTFPGIGWVDVGEKAGRSALNYWASRAALARNPFEGGLYNTLGFFSALWTPCTSDATFTVLGLATGVNAYGKSPAYWQYYPKGNPKYASPWLTKGTKFSPPYKTGAGAQKALNLPPHNPGTAVRPMRIGPGEQIAGPRTPRPQPWRNLPGEGQEYYRGYNFPN